MTITTPRTITRPIREFAQSLGDVDLPTMIPSRPRAESQLSDCFIDVEAQVLEHGGSIQHGWTIWEARGILLQAEFHAVWRDPRGRLIDVSYKPDGEESIVFVPDRTRVFTGARVFSVRRALVSHPMVTEWLAVTDEFDAKVAELNRDTVFGQVVKTNPEIVALHGRMVELELAVSVIARGLNESAMLRRRPGF